MRGGLGAALVVLGMCALARAQGSWDLAKCRASAPPGHLCTPAHLDTDLALLTAREIAKFFDPESQALELQIRRNPLAVIRNPEASVPDPRTDPTLIQLLHAWAERGLIESEGAPGQAGAHRDTVALKRIKRVSLNVEDLDSSEDQCRSADAVLRRAAIGPLFDGKIKVVSDLATPTLYVSVTAAPIGTAACAAFLSITLRNTAYPVPGYEGMPRADSRKVFEDASFLTSPGPEFGERVTDQVRRRVGGFVTEIKLAHQGR
jgi:hypothetical protein